MRTSEQPRRNDVVEIADDHELFRRTLRGFIEAQSGWHVCGEAGDGLEALDKAKVLRPDVVLMDINMPRMNGLEATRLIRRELPECKVVIVTQNHASIARQQGASVNASAAVTKADLTRDLPQPSRAFWDRLALPLRKHARRPTVGFLAAARWAPGPGI
jgi:DNA-binding NarL/FixJ family response regulator